MCSRVGGWHCKALSAKQTTTSATPKRGQHLAPRAYLLHAGQSELGVRRDEEEEKEKRRPPAANLSKPAPGPDSVFAKEGGGQRTRRGCSQQGGSRKLQLGGVRVGLQGQLCPRAAAHGCRPWGPCPPPPPMPSTPAVALSLCQKATGPRRKTYKSAATGIFISPVVFPRVFQEPFAAAGCTAVSGCGQPLCLPRQCRHPAVLA